MRSIAFVLVLILGAAGLASCGGSSGDGGNGAIEVQNSALSDFTIDIIELTGAFNFTYDVNVPPGSSHTLTGLTTGTYDVKITWNNMDMTTVNNQVVIAGQVTTVPVMLSNP